MKESLKNTIIDEKLSLDILNRYNCGEYDHIEAVVPKGFPPVDNKTILDLTGEIEYKIDLCEAEKRLENHSLSLPLNLREKLERGEALKKGDLEDIGMKLMPLYSFGILNGGSATSYADLKKNRAFDPELFELLKKPFEELSNRSKGLAKGITPAFINCDGTCGPSFIELKMRSLLLSGCSSLFQMTSHYNDKSVGETYKKYRNSPYLKDLIAEKGVDICDVKTGIQPLLTAYTHSNKGKNKEVFFDTEGKPLPIPGGHGQCFITLKKVFSELREEGIRFVSLGNVDNMGYTPDPVSLALLCLSGKNAGFDFSYKTNVDKKGGVLVTDQRGHLNCADMGVAIDPQTVKSAEVGEKSILFNCATGLFHLDFLCEKIDWIIENLPMRFSDQDKDAGLYSQAEQVTWEVIGMLDNILIFAIDKYDRFLAAKIIMENLMTSGLRLDSPYYPEGKGLKETAILLNSGLKKKLQGAYGLQLIGDRWESAQ